jgi:hypothetical protein
MKLLIVCYDFSLFNVFKIEGNFQIVFAAEASREGGTRLQILQKRTAGKVQEQNNMMADLNPNSQLKLRPASRQPSLSVLQYLRYKILRFEELSEGMWVMA